MFSWEKPQIKNHNNECITNTIKNEIIFIYNKEFYYLL